MVVEKFCLNLSFGYVNGVVDSGFLQKIEFGQQKNFIEQPKKVYSPFTQQLIEQLNAYSQGARVNWQTRIKSQGTSFQNKVWAALKDIPYGQVMTYGQLASQLQSSARAIGNACRNNPTPIVVPCHRIVAAKSIGGFAGKTDGQLIDIKQRLLALESSC